MRKALIILVIVFVLALAGGVWAYSDIASTGDEVVVEEIVRVGDITAAEGLSMEVRTNYDSNLFWETHFSAGKSGLQESDYRVSVEKDYGIWEPNYTGIEIHSMLDVYDDIEERGPMLTGLGKAYYELYLELSPGEEREKLIYIKDYLDYYPIGGNLSMPGIDLYFEPDRSFWPEFNNEEVYNIVNEYFKIPVLEYESRYISIGLNENGRINSRGNGTHNSGDIYNFYTNSVIMPDAVYFTINNRTNVKNEIIDTSLIPGGYGIYRLPYTMENGVCEVDFRSLSTVKSLDEEFNVIYMMSDEAQEKIILVGVTDDRLSMLVIDAVTMETLQDIELDSGEELHCWQYERGEGFFVFYLKDDRMALVERQDRGEYKMRFTIHDSAATEMYNRYDIVDVAWNGEKLALCGFKGLDRQDWRFVADFYYAVYDETGLLCFVDCDSSLSINGDQNWNGVRGDDLEGIELIWK